MPSRRRSRESALQMIYQWEVSGGTQDHVVQRFFAHFSGGDASGDPFAESLFRSVASESGDLDAAITRHARRWSLERIAPVVRCLLRLAIAELRARRTPPEIVINEALEVGKRFAGAESTAFVNGVLEAARKELGLTAGSGTGGRAARKPPGRARHARANGSDRARRRPGGARVGTAGRN